ncbi:MAG: hypothetical protein JO186_09410 [Actinobacteria bacterium]|nr:hypothetical protein [Actinomycetota bacterium]MBV8396914.1 hypothetical protein [Actinomycetota bacterium]MBV8599493.1 hypothetical protein [Actinomycetota bacterium]
MKNLAKLVPVAALAAAAVAAFPAGSLARTATTQPSKFLTITVVESDKNVRLGIYASTATHDGLIEVGANIPRGDYISINVINVGKKPHDFKIFGHQTKVLKPGGKAHLYVAALIRGTYPYGSTIDKGKSFHGFVNVV